MTHSLTQFATDLTKIVVGVDLFHHHVMEQACQIVEKEAKRVIGTYDYNWTALAESTKADRVSKGFPEDEPLLRTGAMRDSIEHKVETEKLGFEVVGYVGTDSKIAVYQELGTSHIPPRSFLGEAAMHKEHEVHELCGVMTHAMVMTGLGMHVPGISQFFKGATTYTPSTYQKVKDLQFETRVLQGKTRSSQK